MCQRGRALSEASRGGSFLASSTFRWPQLFFGLWQHNCHLCLCLYVTIFSLCVSVFTPCSPLFIRTPVIFIRAHPNELIWIWLHLQRLFPNKVSFTGAQLLGGHKSTYNKGLDSSPPLFPAPRGQDEGREVDCPPGIASMSPECSLLLLPWHSLTAFSTNPVLPLFFPSGLCYCPEITSNCENNYGKGLRLPLFLLKPDALLLCLDQVKKVTDAWEVASVDRQRSSDFAIKENWIPI